MRQVVLDTETTGLEPEAGHRIVEIGCIELVNRRPTERTFHRYLNPDRAVDAGASEVHGIDAEFLAQQPRFEEVAAEFLEFVDGAELVIHNAEFDVGFINHELKRLGSGTQDIAEHCRILDTLALARRLHPGQRNNLDALARRYQVDNSMRELHGALLDAGILANVYLAMTGGQVSLSLGGEADRDGASNSAMTRIDRDGLKLAVVAATAEETRAHRAMLERLAQSSGTPTLWEELESPDSR